MTTEDIQQDVQHALAHTGQGILGPLIRLSKYQDSDNLCVSLVHLSLKDFFLEEATRGDHDLPITREVTAQSSALLLATVCIQYLLLDDFDNDFFEEDESHLDLFFEVPGPIDESPVEGAQGDSPDEGDSYLHPDVLFQEKDALIPEICNSLRSKYGFYEYASIQWAEHFSLCEEVASDSLRSRALTLLDVNTAACRNWLQLCRNVAATPIDDTAIDQDAVVLASQFNLVTTLRHLLGSQMPSQAIKDRSLYWASRLGHERIIFPIIRAGADTNAQTLDRQTALTIAAENGYLACVVELLSDERIDPNTPGRHGRSALSLAAGGGHLDIVNLLLSRSDCRADDPDNLGATPFFWAVGGEHDLIIKTLRRRAKIDINHQDKIGRTAISWAAGDGDSQVLGTLLTLKGIDISISDQRGRSPLPWASGNGHVETVALLLRSRMADKASFDDDKRGAISWASASGHSDVLVCLLNEGCPGADTEDIDGWTPLAWAIQKDSPATVRTLIDSGLVDLDRQDRAGRTALSWAVEYGHAKVVEVLLEAGADPSIESKAGSTPVTVARSYGRDYLVTRLVASKT